MPSFKHHICNLSTAQTIKALSTKPLATVFVILLALGLAASTLVSLRGANAATGNAQLVVSGESAYYAGYSTAKMYVDDTLVYCATPSKKTPAAGTYAKSDLYVTYESSQKETVISWLAKLVYYGYGGPGFDASMWPRTWYDGSAMTTNNYIALTHIMIADIFSGEGSSAMYGCNQSFKNWVYDSIFKWDENDKVNNNTTEAKILAASLPEGFASSCFVLKTGSGSQCVIGYTPSGALDLQKASALTAITTSNACYSLAGARYGIYHSKADATNNEHQVGILKTNESGYATIENLTPGVYYIKEVTPPSGYALDSTIYSATVKGGSTTRINANKIAETPQSNPVLIMAGKYDADRSYNSQGNAPQGDASLEGAHFLVRYYDGFYSSAKEAISSGNVTRSWTFESDEQGLITYSASALIEGDPLYTASDREPCLPLGTYLIEEKQAPVGYQAADRIALCQVTSQGTKEAVASYDAPAFANTIVRGGIAIYKRDSQTNTTAQGNASLAGITFEIVNESANPVIVKNKEYQPHAVVATLTTNDQGYAATDKDALPYGTYLVREKSTNDSMRNTFKEQTVIVSEAGKVYQVTAEDDVVRGGVSVTKLDHESSLTTPLGAGVLDGACFEITNRSNNPVMVDGALYEPGEVVATIVSSQGVACTSKTALPYGHYGLQEVSSGEGYLVSDARIYEFDINEHGSRITINEAGAIENQVKRGDLELVKARTSDGARLAHVPFKITSQTTGESHVIITDDNGYASTAHSWNAHSFKTNQNDELDPDTYDPEAGIWFGLTTEGWTTTPRDELGALPYDTYTIEELRCDANEGLNLVTLKDIAITRDGVCINLGTIDNHDIDKPLIATTAHSKDDGSKQLTASPCNSISDHVWYYGLTAGKEYTFRAWLVDEQGHALSDSETTKTFTPQATAGSIDITLTSNLMTHNGSKVVVFEECLYNDTVIAEHKDLEDSEQTLYLKPYTIGTCAYSSQNNTKTLTADPCSSITDTLSYADLPARATMSIEGQVMIKSVDEGGIPTAIPLTVNGKPVTQSTEFTTSQSGSGTTSVSYTFDSTNLSDNAELVIYETLYYHSDTGEKIKIACEQTPDNDAQSVSLARMSINTQARDKVDNDQTVITDTSSSWYDRISYHNATIGEEYTACARMVWADTGENVAIDGKEVVASLTFTPKTSEGDVTIPFYNVDTSMLEAGQVALIEQLYRNDILIAEEKSLDIADQRLTFIKPALSTCAYGNTDQHTTLTSSATTLYDTVAYQNIALDDSSSYRMMGFVMDTETRLPLLCGDTRTITNDELQAFCDDLCSLLHIDSFTEHETPDVMLPSSYELDFDALQDLLKEHDDLVQHLAFTIQPFDPKTESGSMQMTFDELDTTQLDGTTAVVFELLMRDDYLVASHLDFTDTQQQISLVGPHLATTLTDTVDQDHYLLSSQASTLTDTVSYSDLEPGLTYTLEGILMNKATGEAFLVNNSEITASKTFTPQTSEGTVELSFKVDTTTLNDGDNLVAFEYLYCDSTLISEHADIDDTEQTVTIGISPATQAAEEALYDKTGASIALFIGIGIASLATGAYLVHRARSRRRNALLRALRS